MPRLLISSCLLLCVGALYAQPAPFVPARDPQVVAFSPSGNIVATGVSGLPDGLFPPRPHPSVRKSATVFLWDAESGKRLKRMDTYGDFTQIKFSPDGSLIAATRLFQTGDELSLPEVRLWDVVSGQTAKVLDRCHAFDFSPDGKTLAAVSRTKCVLYDVASWERKTEIEPLGGAVSVTFGRDALFGVMKTAAGYTIRKWELANGFLEAETLPLASPFYRAAVSPDGLLLATGHEGVVLVRSTESLDPLFQLPLGQPGIAHPFFAPDGKRIAAGCQANGDVIVWDAESRQELQRFTFEKGRFRPFLSRPAEATFRPETDPQRFVFSPDGKSFLAGAHGGIVRSADDGREVRSYGE